MSAFTTWLCLRIWGVTFFLESFCLGETSWIPASSARRPIGPKHRLGAQVPGAPAGAEPHRVGLQALPDGLQSSLAHPSGPGVTGLRDVTFQSAAPHPVSVPFPAPRYLTFFQLPCHKLRFVPSTMQAACQYLCSPPFFVSFFTQNTLIPYPDWPGLPGRRPRPVLLPASPAARSGFPLAPPGLLASLLRAIRPARAPVFFYQRCWNASIEKHLFRHFFPIALASIRAFFGPCSVAVDDVAFFVSLHQNTTSRHSRFCSAIPIN